jgi:hypothetical protein
MKSMNSGDIRHVNAKMFIALNTFWILLTWILYPGVHNYDLTKTF